MKTWRMGSGETMWACGSCNMPEHKDVIVDMNGKEWVVHLHGGYTLRDRDGNTHSYIRDREPWFILAGWFNEYANVGSDASASSPIASTDGRRGAGEE